MDLINHEPAVRLGAFAAGLLVVAACEALAPRRERAVGRLARWPHNLALVALNTLLVRAVVPISAVSLAALAEERGWGLFNGAVSLGWVTVLVSVALLDLAIYLQHVMFHAVPVLWRLHRMHHADLDFDVTTGVRFHPVEILLSTGYKLALVGVLGIPAIAVVVFEVLLNTGSMFNHANLRLPKPVDRALRWLVVTLDMHRVHHSAAPAETNSNFGFTLPWWDRLCGTYRAEPAAGHERMTIGLAQPLLGGSRSNAMMGRRRDP